MAMNQQEIDEFLTQTRVAVISTVDITATRGCVRNSSICCRFMAMGWRYRRSYFSSSLITTIRSTYIPGRWMASGFSSPTGTILSSTSTMVTVAAMAMIGLKLR